MRARQTYWIQWKSGAQDYDGLLRHAEVAAPATSYTIYGLNGGTQYTVRVIALDSNGHAFQPSTGATAAATAALPDGWENPPGPVGTLQVQPPGSLEPDQFRLDWRKVSDADAYYVQWKSGMQDYDASRQRVWDWCFDYCNMRIDGLDPETTYTFRVMAVKGSFDAGGVFTASSDPGRPSELVVTTPAWPVAAPANLAAAGDSGTTIRVTWDAVPALVVTEDTTDYYRLHWRLSSETDDDYDTDREVLVTATAAPSYTITGLTPNTAYTVRVRADDRFGR